VCLQIIFSGAMFMAIGILGNYVSRIYEETKRRPLYVVASSSNIAASGRPERGLVLEQPLPPTAPEKAKVAVLIR
jgi:hypothetical protein